MLTPESQVLARHLDLFTDKKVLFLGNVQDDFPATCQQTAREVRVVSSYFDYVQRAKLTPIFALEAEYQAEDLIVFYWGKNKQECQFQLQQMLSQVPIGQSVLIVGENRGGVRSAETFCEKWGNIAKIDSARRCGLYHFELQQAPDFRLAEWWREYTLAKYADLTVCSLPGVFSATELDQGTALLLSTLQQPIQGNVLDVGCGAGVIGAYLKQQNPTIELTMTDIHAMALASAQQTLAKNHLAGNVIASNVFSAIPQKFNLIVSNPPFHAGIDTAYDAVETLIREAKAHLYKGGELRIVANAFLPYPDVLDRYFGSHQVLAKTGKFKVYRVIN
ncbi:16S rRNA (guanine(1207)-N(2))-methyltransferase RsmC [Gallibacterium melopsittaci]|uniref:Ribosomal RNA small subunit methyltransferase C n=1 Tax=Gallibacterium melopsittaci TaxID=516063 RepID=A0ABV6HT18_9PAST